MELSANQYMCPDGYGTRRFLNEAREAGFSSVALTRAAVADIPVTELRLWLDDAGMTVTSLNSAGYFTWQESERRAAQSDQNRWLIEAASELGASVLCVITGGSATQPDVDTAREKIAEGLAELDAIAASAGVRLGLEPIHPRDVPTKGCINTISQALDMVRSLSSTGVILDLYHSWWDPDLAAAAGDPKVFGVQICNVICDDHRMARSPRLSGGVIDVIHHVRRFRHAGYDGYFEFEIFAKDHGLNDISGLLVDARELFRQV